MFSSGGGGGFGGHAAQFLGGLFGDSGAPYKDAMKEYERWAQKGEGAQNPFLDFGKRAMPGYEEWVGGMKDPSGFINKLMGGYQESPYAHYQQEQGMRAAQNMGSASGMTGSTPLTQFAQQNAQNISSQDMNQWLQNVLGINSMYGSGLNNQIGYGQHAADQLTGMYGDMGRQMGAGAFGQRAGRNQDFMNGIGGWFGMGGDMLGGMFGGM